MEDEAELDARAAWVVSTLIDLAKQFPKERRCISGKPREPLRVTIGEMNPKWRPVDWVPPPRTR